MNGARGAGAILRRFKKSGILTNPPNPPMKHRVLFIALLSVLAVTPVRASEPIAAPAAPAVPGFTLDDLKAQIPMTPEGRFLMEVPQILNTSTDRAVQALLLGQEVETTGQLIAGTPGNPGGGLRIFRAELLCCSAHTRKCSVALEFEGAAPDATGSPWVELAGVLSFRTEDGATAPCIRVKVIKKALPPAKAVLR